MTRTKTCTCYRCAECKASERPRCRETPLPNAIEHHPQSIGTELHPAYYKQAVKNITEQEMQGQQTSLFSLLEI